MALDSYELSLCDGCGKPLTEGCDPENDGWIEMQPAQVCHGCAAVEAHRKDKTEHPAGQKWALVNTHPQVSGTADPWVPAG